MHQYCTGSVLLMVRACVLRSIIDPDNKLTLTMSHSTSVSHHPVSSETHHLINIVKNKKVGILFVYSFILNTTRHLLSYLLMM